MRKSEKSSVTEKLEVTQRPGYHSIKISILGYFKDHLDTYGSQKTLGRLILFSGVFRIRWSDGSGIEPKEGLASGMCYIRLISYSFQDALTNTYFG